MRDIAHNFSLSRSIVRKLLASAATDEKSTRRLRRWLWLYDGFLEHRLRLDLLLPIYKVFTRLDDVPPNYDLVVFCAGQYGL